MFLCIQLYDITYWEKAGFLLSEPQISINAHFGKFNKLVWIRVYLRMKWLEITLCAHALSPLIHTHTV
jgi:hypothetical protein